MKKPDEQRRAIPKSKKGARPKRRRYTAAELMKDFKPEYRHPEWDAGPPVGKEIW